jgi:DNA-binding LacI/PurR family transcriptional regulator
LTPDKVNSAEPVPKHQQIYDALFQAIIKGRYAEGARLPSESELVEQFQVSRPTVNRALRDLQERGFIDRRAGSGSYVRLRESEKAHVFGLLIPDASDTEIFEPICQGLAESRYNERNALLWGSTGPPGDSKELVARRLCKQYVECKVSGVLFAPLELTRFKDEVNEEIVTTLSNAGIPVMLLDRCIYSYPRRSRFDVVGIDNRRAGFVITDHFLKAGCCTVAFLGRPQSASTVDARVTGYREALHTRQQMPDRDLVWRGNPDDIEFIRERVRECRPDAIVCANDNTAAHLLYSLNELGLKVPNDLRIAGIDDVKYAAPLSLTTLRQPCRQIGVVAMSAMLERLERSDIPARDILLDFELVVRRSSGTAE